MTRGKKILVGCLVAVAALILTFILAVVFAVSWVKSPSPDLDGQRLVDAGTRVYAELRLREEDQAVRQLLRTFVATRNQAGLDQFKAADIQDVPPFVRKFLPMFQKLGAGEVQDKDLDKILPVAAFLTFAGSHADGARPLLAINFPASGHVLSLLDWFMARAARNDGELEVVTHGEEAIYNVREKSLGWFCIVKTDVLWSPEKPALLTGIENLARTERPPSPPALVSLLAAAPDDTAFRLAAVGDGAAELPGLLSPWIPGLADLLRDKLAGARSISGWGRLESADRLTGVLFVSADQETGEAIGGGSRYTLEFHDGALRFTLADAGVESDGRRRWEFALEGVEELIRTGARNLDNDNGVVFGP
jgi:hypothetical protein